MEEKFILFKTVAAMIEMSAEELLTIVREGKYKKLLDMRMFDNKRWVSKRGFQDFLNLQDQYKIRRRQKHLLRIAELYAFLVVLAILKMKLGAWVDENIFLLQNIELGVGDDKTKTTNFSLTIETVGTFYIKK